jgi:NAD(P)H-hydrate epimerase
VVLKGAGTIITDPEETAFVVPAGNPGMASGGTGDVLAGIIGALLCQGLNACEAACVGAFLHGLAGDRASAAKSQHALIAGDIIEALPKLLSDFEGWHDQDDSELDQYLP